MNVDLVSERRRAMRGLDGGDTCIWLPGLRKNYSVRIVSVSSGKMLVT